MAEYISVEDLINLKAKDMKTAIKKQAVFIINNSKLSILKLSKNRWKVILEHKREKSWIFKFKTIKTQIINEDDLKNMTLGDIIITLYST